LKRDKFYDYWLAVALYSPVAIAAASWILWAAS
jgi:hypothetical protein